VAGHLRGKDTARGDTKYAVKDNEAQGFIRGRISPGGLRGLQIRRGAQLASLVGSTPMRPRHPSDIRCRITGERQNPSKIQTQSGSGFQRDGAAALRI